MIKHWKLGLVGYPLEHSFSPRLHAAALLAGGLAGEYRLYPVRPGPAGVSALPALLERLRRGEIDGLNVTIPYKQAVIPFLDDLTPLARAIGAVNTIYRRGKTLVGDNTDAPAFQAVLSRVLPPPSTLHAPPSSPQASPSSPHTSLAGPPPASPISKTRNGGGGNPHPTSLAPPPSAPAPPSLASFAPLRFHPSQSHPRPSPHALILGSGGAARAVVFALAQSGWRISIAARRVIQALELARSVHQSAPDCSLSIFDLDHSTLFAGPPPALIVNCTPVGMTPATEAAPWPSDLPFPAEAFVYDLVYTPPETTLVLRARAAGLAAATGLGMLIEQAALAFEQWTGQAAPRAAMQAAVQETIQ